DLLGDGKELHIGLDRLLKRAVLLGELGIAQAIDDDGGIAEHGFEFTMARQSLFESGPHGCQRELATEGHGRDTEKMRRGRDNSILSFSVFIPCPSVARSFGFRGK